MEQKEITFHLSLGRMYVKCLDGKVVKVRKQLPCFPVEYYEKLGGNPVRSNKVEIDRESKTVCLDDGKMRQCFRIKPCKDKKSFGIIDPISGQLTCFLKPRIKFEQTNSGFFVDVDPFPFEYLIMKKKTCSGEQDYQLTKGFEFLESSGWTKVSVYTPFGGKLVSREFWFDLEFVPGKIPNTVKICGKYNEPEPVMIFCPYNGQRILLEPGKKYKVAITCPGEPHEYRWNPVIGWYDYQIIKV